MFLVTYAKRDVAGDYGDFYGKVVEENVGGEVVGYAVDCAEKQRPQRRVPDYRINAYEGGVGKNRDDLGHVGV